MTNLVPAHNGNTNAARHGLDSDRVIADEIERHYMTDKYRHLLDGQREAAAAKLDRLLAATG